MGNVRFFNCDPFPNKQSLHQTDFVLGFRLIKSDFVTSLLLDDPATVPELTLEEVDGPLLIIFAWFWWHSTQDSKTKLI